MNKERRAKINKLIGQLDDIKMDIEVLKDEEQAEQGKAMETTVSEMEEAISGLENSVRNLETACEG